MALVSRDWWPRGEERAGDQGGGPGQGESLAEAAPLVVLAAWACGRWGGGPHGPPRLLPTPGAQRERRDVQAVSKESEKRSQVGESGDMTTQHRRGSAPKNDSRETPENWNQVCRNVNGMGRTSASALAL